MLISIIGLILGVAIGFFVNISVSAVMSVYIAIGILAAFDSVLGGVVATMKKTFNITIFISGFFGNALLAVAIVFLGTKLGLDLYIAVVVVFGIRIFQNFAIIRRLLLNKFIKSDIIKNDIE